MNAPELLRSTRKAAGLNQTQAAQLCGVSFSAYEKWERGAPIHPPMLAGLLLMLGAKATDAKAAGLAAVEAEK